MSYKPNYQGGWKSGESGGTPITPEALNHMEDGIEHANENILPALQAADNATFLRNDNTWQKVTPANIGAAADSHYHDASEINDGVLSSDRLPTVPVTKGGTGATTETAARKNLGLGNFVVKEVVNTTAKGVQQTLKDIFSSLSNNNVYIIRISDTSAQKFAIGQKYADNYGYFISCTVDGFFYYINYNGTWAEKVITTW